MIPNKKWLVSVIYCLSWLFSLYVVLQYIIYSPRDAGMVAAKLEDSTFPYAMWQIFFYPHIVLGLLALLIGALFVPFIALYATGGTPSTVAFIVLDLLWMLTTVIGVRQILNKNLVSHRIWMLRSYAITLVFVTFRIILAFLSLYSHDFSVIFSIAVYASILINLSFTEFYLRTRRFGIHV